jgi:hypothetical protein
MAQPHRTPAQRAAILEGLRNWRGTRAAYAAKVGISQPTLWRWLAESPPPQRVPTLVEVVAPSETSSLIMMLPGNLQLAFDTLPPATWVASLATALARC